LKQKSGFELDIFFQGIFEPIQAQTKKALVDPFRRIDQGCVVIGDHMQALGDHPNVSQASGDQQTA